MLPSGSAGPAWGPVLQPMGPRHLGSPSTQPSCPCPPFQGAARRRPPELRRGDRPDLPHFPARKFAGLQRHVGRGGRSPGVCTLLPDAALSQGGSAAVALQWLPRECSRCWDLLSCLQPTARCRVLHAHACVCCEPVTPLILPPAQPAARRRGAAHVAADLPEQGTPGAVLLPSLLCRARQRQAAGGQHAIMRGGR